jgi:hypothetical protein
MNRRGFLSFLTKATFAATVAPHKFLDALLPDPHHALTEFQLDALIPPEPVPQLSETLNAITQRYIIPQLADTIFALSPTFLALSRRDSTSPSLFRSSWSPPLSKLA